MKALRGTALFCGIGNGVKEMEAHLAQAAKAGINAVFSSLQLPESNKEDLLRDFPKMAQIAHRYGMLVDADISERTANLFGLDLHDFAAFKQMGVDIARMDYGYSDEALVKASFNEQGIIIELNAVTATEEWLQKLCDMGINKEQIHFCHNYYPMRYTGMRVEEVIKANEVIHKYGFRVGGFVPSQTHHRIGCSIGLPTLERHREMGIFTAVQEMFLYGMDDVFFGDDYASYEEMKTLVEADESVVTFRMRPFVEGKLTEWLMGRVLRQTQFGLDDLVRSRYDVCSYPGDPGDPLSCRRYPGDVTVCKTGLLRYSGEIELVRRPLPKDDLIGLIGRIVDEDLPLLESLQTDKPFRLVRDQ